MSRPPQPASRNPHNPEASSELGRRLRSASGPQLRELVQDFLERLTPMQVRLVLLNPFVTTEIIEELLGARHATADASVRAALARHRKTPEIDAVRLIPNLFWRDLMEISVDLRLRPNVRRIAEKYLIARLPRLSIGEKIALARRGGPQILTELLQHGDLRTTRALLDNPRLTEQILVDAARRREARPRMLDLIGKHPRWGRAADVRFALARNPMTPLAVIFDILPLLRADECAAVLEVADHSSLVHREIRELLKNRSPESPAGGPESEVWEI